ncbi:MAG: hypothetical protein RIS36_2204 [Pseudomonadota bacterium]|jgi:hypothetical protein
MGLELKKVTSPGNNEPLPKMTGLPGELFSEIYFDCRGFQDRRRSESNLATAPEAASTIKTATHGFSIVTAADGYRAVQFIQTLKNGTTETFQICEGARGIETYQLASYGINRLEGATLRAHHEFKRMVKELLKSVKGLMVVNEELQTGDEALKLAYQIVQEGVRRQEGRVGERPRNLGDAFVKFFTEGNDGARVVSGGRVTGFSFSCGYNNCAFFGVSSPKPKK